MNKRSVLIDIFRIILCVGVVVFHYTPVRPCSGSLMVLGFFVMGGFLLGMDFERLNEFNLKSFYVHKAKRFLPLLLVALGLGVVASAVKHWLLPSEYGLFPCPEDCSASNLSFYFIMFHCGI